MTDAFTRTEHLNGKVTLYGGDNRDVLKSLPASSIDSIVTDPPYALVSIVKRFGNEESHLHVKDTKDLSTIKAAQYKRLSGGFMGKKWDTGEVAFSEVFWAECLRVLKPGGHVVAFSGTRTYHRMAVAIEDAGFEIRDQLAWCYGSGFPKSHDVSKAIDKAAGVKRAVGVLKGKSKVGGGDIATTGMSGGEYYETQAATPQAAEWQGWGTALKPSWEPICLARKPLAVPVDDIRDADAPAVRMRAATVAENVLEHGTGALNIDGCRVATDEVISNHGHTAESGKGKSAFGDFAGIPPHQSDGQKLGRWPANIVHDGSDEVVACFPDSKSTRSEVTSKPGAVNGAGNGLPSHTGIYGFDDSGSAARFFYTAKADKLDRIGSKHPTVKPVDLMQWLVRLVTPKGGLVLDPFAGSGSTGEAAWREGMRCILIEREGEYQADIAERLRLADKGPATRKAKAIKQAANDNLPLFDAVAAPPMRGEGRQIYGHFADLHGRRNNGR